MKKFPTPRAGEGEGEFVDRALRQPAVIRAYSNRSDREAAARREWRENGNLPASNASGGKICTMDFPH